MFLVLAHDQDLTARGVYAELCARHGANEVAFLTDEVLLGRTGWNFLQADGLNHTKIRLVDERWASAQDLRGVFNRLTYLNVTGGPTFSADDRDYFVSEMFALLLGVFSTLPGPVVNPIDVRGLSGAKRSLLEWLFLAGQADLPVRRVQFATSAREVSANGFEVFRPPAGASLLQPHLFKAVEPGIAGRSPALMLEPVVNDHRRVTIIGDQVVGAVPEVRTGCLKLAEMAKAPLMQCTFSRAKSGPQEWLCASVDPFPQLTPHEIGLVADLLERGSTTA